MSKCTVIKPEITEDDIREAQRLLSEADKVPLCSHRPLGEHIPAFELALIGSKRFLRELKLIEEQE